MKKNLLKASGILITYIYSIAQYITVSTIFLSVPLLLVINFIKVSDYNLLLIILSIVGTILLFSYPLFLLADAASGYVVKRHDSIRYRLVKKLVAYIYKAEIEQNQVEIDKFKSACEFMLLLEKLKVIPRITYFDRGGISDLYYKLQSYHHYVKALNVKRDGVEIAERFEVWLKK